MKRFLQKAVCLILLFLLALPAKAYASNGSGNMDGGGSGMGQGTEVWAFGSISHFGSRPCFSSAGGGAVGFVFVCT